MKSAALAENVFHGQTCVMIMLTVLREKTNVLHFAVSLFWDQPHTVTFCIEVAHKCPNAFLCQIALDTCIAKPCSGQPQCADYSDQDPDVSSGIISRPNLIDLSQVCSAISRMRQNVTCQVNEFACHSGGQCIHQFYRCDGVQDCADGSDETAAAGCSHFVGMSLVDCNRGFAFIS